MRRLPLLLLSIVVQIVLPRSASAAEKELWYDLLLRDHHCGWMRSVEDREEGNLRSATETHMRLDRAGQSVTIEMATEFVETPEGVPVKMTIRTATGGPEVVSEYFFPAQRGPGATVRTVVRQGEQVREGSEPYPAGDWLPPIAAEKYFAMRRAAGAKEVVYETVDGQSGLAPSRVTSTLVGDGEALVEGRTIPVTRWRVITSLIPIETTIAISSDGELVSSSTMLGSERMETRLSTKERATRTDGKAPELMVSMMVRPDRVIPRAEVTRAIVYRVGVKEGEMPDLPSAGAQRFERSDAGSGLLRVDVDRPQPASAEERVRSAYLEPSAAVDSDHPLVRSLTAKALKGHENDPPAAKAERLRRAVHGHVNYKGLATAFATAGETARSGEGDCSEHAVLLAAMLRAAGIPSRTAVGLVYADAFAGQRDVFAWHMWTQALVQAPVVADGAGRGDAPVSPPPGAPLVWLDLDATLPDRTPYHAAHILTAVSDLSAGPMDPAMAQVVPLLGRLWIGVGEEAPSGAESGSPPSAAPTPSRP